MVVYPPVKVLAHVGHAVVIVCQLPRLIIAPAWLRVYGHDILQAMWHPNAGVNLPQVVIDKADAASGMFKGLPLAEADNNPARITYGSVTLVILATDVCASESFCRWCKARRSRCR